MQISQQPHRFFHVDRYASLVEGQNLELNENGASRFGCAYWPTIENTPVEELDENHLREHVIETVRRHPEFHLYPSRRQVLFAANSIEEATNFGREILPIPEYDSPIFEIFATKFWTLDMSWLDYKTDRDIQKMRGYAENYWLGRISNHCPVEGTRKPPRLEVLILLPAQVGKIVGYVSSKEPPSDTLNAQCA